MQEIINDARHNISLKSVSISEVESWSKKLVCIAGPSGVGKTCLCNRLQNIKPGFFYLLGSTVTRPRSKIDTELNNYHVIPEEKFDYFIKQEKFLHWYETVHGYYGIEKERIRNALKNYTYVLVVFRSKSADALKSILPNLKVIELCAPLKILRDQISNRERHELKTISAKLNTAQKDMERNELFYKYWSQKPENNWHQLCNEKFEPPISNDVVNEALSIISK